MSVVLSPKAAEDLEEIADYIARDDPARALSFVNAIRERITEIARFPEAAAIREQLGPGIRGLVFKNYTIFYRILKEEIRIDRVLHSARDVRRL